ncbi:MAG: DUF4249 family protein, partial [Bacteroidota bacterium]
MWKLVSIIALVFLCGCEDVINIDLPENQNLVVIEGWVTNENKRQEIRISQTLKFDDPNTDTSIKTAQITVSRDTITYNYTHQANGLYLSDEEFIGVEGSFYGLQIILEAGDTIRSESFERMPEMVPLTGVRFDFFE